MILKKENSKKATRKDRSVRQTRKEIVGYRPRVVVKFRDYLELPYIDGVEDFILKNRIGPWEKLAKEFPGITLKRLFTAVNPEQIHSLVEKARKLDPEYRPHNLLTYFVLEIPPGVAPETFIKTLMSWESVQTAYFDPPGEDPQVNPNDDPRFANQGYLDQAPDGIDAEFAWPRGGGVGFAGGDGAGIRVIDLERGWTLNHEDLTAHGASLLHGSIRDASRAHGTSVLGEICAVDNALGDIGIAPNIASINVVSYWNSNIPDAILAAIVNLTFGDILLLEVQINVTIGTTNWNLMPIEVLEANFDAIRLATALGIVVTEAAGNGGTDLDTFADAAGNAVLDRNAGGFRDSGAIMVACASSTAPHGPWCFVGTPNQFRSSFGSRIDCYAWGENVDTCSSNDTGSTTMYTGTFNGTSSASPIITGAAAIVQGIAEAGLGYRFSPRQIRAILSDPATGTASNNPAVDRIGVMPDLNAILQNNVLNLAPDVYIRDFVGDTGDPHTGAISASPDVILRPTIVANPQATYGQGSGTENSDMLGYEAEKGQNNYIYVRMRNRGGSAATNVTATVFWSPVSTLITPDLWTPVGAVTLANLPTGNVLTVTDAITWLDGAIPAKGHYCFVCLVGNAQDPAPNTADFTNWDNFRRFIRENNNVTWRNFNVVDNDPDPEAYPVGFVSLPFIVPGAPDKARRMRLELVAQLPKGAKVMIEVPLYLGDFLQTKSPLAIVDEKHQVVRLPVNPHGRTIILEAALRAKTRTKVRLLVNIPKELRQVEYEVFARQLYGEEEVGRVTWHLVPRELKKKMLKV